VFEGGEAVGILCEMMASGGASPIELPRVVSCCDRHPGGGETVRLRDGRTGEGFGAPVSVGALHLLKLTPLADDVFEALARGAAHAVATGSQAFARFMETLQAVGLDVASPRRYRPKPERR